MKLVLLISLLYLCCSAQVFADAVDGTQTLDCDATVQKQHRVLLQYSQAHLTTVRSAIRNINDSLQGLTQREQDVKEEADKSRELATLLQDVLSKMKNNGADGADENTIFAEKLEKEITDLKSRLLQLVFKLSVLKIEEQTMKLQLKQMQTQEKELEISISQQKQIGPLENIETYLVAQLERSHETLELERQCCQFKLEATSKLMVSNSKLVDSELKQVESKYFQIWKSKEAKNSNAIKNISEHLDICEKEKTNLKSENTQIAAELLEKSRQLESALSTTTTTARPTTWTPPTGAVTLSTGTYFFNAGHLNWISARKHCQSLGMDLVAIETEAENVALGNHAQKLSFWGTWTSGCYSRREDAVVWRSSGHNISYTNWFLEDKNHGNLRNENLCVRLYPPDKAWRELPINDQRPSICEKI